MLLVSNVQRFCLHDGPGIRTTVFLKGCPLSCPWCCNPENRSFSPQYFYRKNRCLLSQGTNCQECSMLLAEAGVSTPEQLAGKRVSTGREFRDPCPLALGIWGRPWDEAKLCAVLEEDRPYYEQSGGGVTLSGGEPLAHPIEKLVCNLAQSGIHVAVETSLLLKSACLSAILQHISLFIVDAKIMDREDCRHILGGISDDFLNNLGKIIKAKKQVLLRIPLIDKLTATDENIQRICDVINTHRIAGVQLLPQHRLGDEKRMQLAECPSCCDKLPPDVIQKIAGRIGSETAALVDVLSF